MWCRFHVVLCVLLLALCASGTAARAQDEDYLTPNLIPNGDVELDADGNSYPDGWPRVANAALMSEDGNRFLRVKPYDGPTFELPLKPDWIAVQVSCRMRCQGIKMGPEGYHDARMVMSWNDADHQHVEPWPNVLRGTGTFDWREMERTFIRPPGAEFLSIGAVNFAAEGTVDYDDVVVRGQRTPPLRDVPRPEGAEGIWDIGNAWRLKSQTRDKVCLNGLWQFRPVLTEDQIASPPQGPGWGYFKVPGSWRGDGSLQIRAAAAWEMTDFGALQAAWYRRELTVPNDWAGRKIELQFDLVQSRANVFIDGLEGGHVLWPGGTLDVTEFCRPGATHTLSVLVLALPRDTATQSFMGPDRVFEVESELNFRGLCGDVYLLSGPPAGGIEDVFVRPSVQEERIELDAKLALPAGDGFRLRARVEHGGRAVKEFTSEPFSQVDLQDGSLTFGSRWADPPLWDIDDPKLCMLHLALVDREGAILDEALPVEFGFRDFRIEGRDLYMNGKRIHLRALDLGNANTADAGSSEGATNTYRRMRKYGFNSFIMSNYHFQVGAVGYFRDMLRAADREGTLLAFSLPHCSQFGWRLDDPEVRESYRALAGWIVGQVRHHPSVVLYTMNHNATGYQGDQNPALLHGRDPGPVSRNREQALVAQQIAESLDPTRPVYHHQSGNLGSFITLNCYLNWAPMRERSRWLAVWAAEGVKPFFFVEWGLPHIASWSSYRGPQFIWRANVMQQAWTHEFAATFKGDDAYEFDRSDEACLRTELRYWKQDQPFHYWDILNYFRDRERNVLEIKSLYASKNWPAHRTWGMSAMLPWDQGDFWRHKDGLPTERIPLETEWNRVQRPGLSPDVAIGGGDYLTSRYPEEDWEPSCVGRTFLRCNRPLLAYLGGKAGDFTEEGHNFLPGERVEKQVIVVNDSRRTVGCSYRWSLGDVTAGRGTIADVEPGGIRKERIAAELPRNVEPGTHRLALSVEFPGGEVQQDAMDVHVLGPAREEQARGRIALYDPEGKTAETLAGLGVPFTEVRRGADLKGYDLLIVGREALSASRAAPDISRVTDGLNVLVFEQTEQVLSDRLGFRTQVYGLRRVFPRVPDHPILNGLSAENLRAWRGDATLYPPYMEETGGYNNYPQVRWCGFVNSRVWRCGNGGNVATALIEKPARGNFLPIVDGGFDLQYAPLLELRQGKGTIVFCQMDVTGRTEQDPAARRLVRNLMRYCVSPQPFEARDVYYVGSPEGAEALAKLGVAAQSPAGAEPGAGDLLVLGPAAESPRRAELEGAVKGGLNLLLLANGEAGLQRAPVRARWKVGTVASSRLKLPVRERAFQGLSNAETHFRNFRDLPLLSQVETADERGLLAAADLGRGKVVFCQAAPWMFDPADFDHDRMTYRRTACLLGRILGNLEAPMETPLLRYWAEPAMVLPDLSARWRGRPDPDDVGRTEGWQSPDFDGGDWPQIEVAATWESQRPDLADYNGVFWYRTRFDLGAVPPDADLVLVMGAVDDEDWTYLNGEMIGSVTNETHPDDHWAVERRYPIPPGLLKETGNVLAVRVNDTYLSGGIVRGPVAIQAPGRWQKSYYVDEPEADDDPYRYYRW